MQSKTSFFNGAVFRKRLTRFWPLWLGYAFVLFLTTPAAVLNRLSIALYHEAGTPVQDLLLGQTTGLLPLLSCIFGLLLAAATFDFLFTARGTGLMASLPVRREGAFLSCYAAGVVMLLSSDVLIALITLIVEAANGAVHLPSLLMWLAVLSMEGLLFYSIAVFCAMLTGHILVLPCLYLLFNVGVALLQALVAQMLSLFVFGLSYGTSSWGVEILSPIIAIVRDTDVVYTDLYLGNDAVGSSAVGLRGWWTIGGWCIAGLLLAVCALLLYRRRRMESAGDTVAIPVLRPVLKYIVTAFCALGFPICMCYLILGSRAVSSFPLFLALTVVGVAIGYYASEMIIRKSFRVFRGRWKGVVITAVLFCALLCAAKFDFFGYERRVPDADSVASVTVGDYEPSEFRSAENIESVCELHRSIVANKALHKDCRSTQRVDFQYTLKNGKTLSRSYYIADDESQYTEDSDLRKLERLFNTDEGQLANEALHPEIPVSSETISYASVNYPDEFGDYVHFELTTEEALELYETAIVPDCEAGTLGRRWLIFDETYAATVYDVEINIDLNERISADHYNYESLYFRPQIDSVRTVAWLQAHGVNLTYVTANTVGFKPTAAQELTSIG